MQLHDVTIWSLDAHTQFDMAAVNAVYTRKISAAASSVGSSNAHALHMETVQPVGGDRSYHCRDSSNTASRTENRLYDLKVEIVCLATFDPRTSR